MFNPKSQLPTQKGTEVWPQVMQQPAAVRHTYYAAKAWLQQDYARADQARLDLLAKITPDFHQFVQAQRQNYALGVARFTQATGVFDNARITYMNKDGMESIHVELWVEAFATGKKTTDTGDVWKIGYDNDGTYDEDPQRNYSSRKWFDDAENDTGGGTAVYMGRIDKLVYWECKLIEIGKDLHAYFDNPIIDWSKPPVDGAGKDTSGYLPLPALGVLAVPGVETNADDFEKPDKPTQADIRKQIAYPWVVGSPQVGRPSRVEEGGIIIPGEPVGEIIARDAGAVRLYVAEPPEGGSTTVRVKTGGGWSWIVDTIDGSVPEDVKVDKSYPWPVTVTSNTPNDTNLFWSVVYPVYMSPGDTTKYAIVRQQLYRVPDTAGEEKAADKIWTSLGPGTPPDNPPENDPARTTGFSWWRPVTDTFPTGADPNAIRLWATGSGEPAGTVSGHWSFTEPTYDTVTVPTPPDPNSQPGLFDSQVGWHSPEVLGGAGGLDSDGQPDDYTTTLYSGNDFEEWKADKDEGDVFMFAVDLKNGGFWMGRNGKWKGETPRPGGSGDVTLDIKDTDYYPAVSYSRGATKVHMLFGSAQKYAPPSGFTRLGASQQEEL